MPLLKPHLWLAATAVTAPLLLAQTDNLALPHIAGTVYSGAGANPAAIQQVVDDFRAAIGTTLNPPGPAANPATGRREINWDGVPTSLTSPNKFPPDFFNRTSASGAVFSGPPRRSITFEVSGNEASGQLRFDNLGPGYSQIFQAFSGDRLFTSIGTQDYDVDFFVAGTQERGSVSAFGAVFCNVAIATASSLEFFTADGVSLGRYYVRVARKGLSFLGVTFPTNVVAKVRVIPGTAPLGEVDDPENGVNVVVVDDFLYSEPTRKL